MNKQQLAAKIWESANKMRSKIEANEYKDYILGFIFYKFLSETEIARLRAEDWGAEDLKGLDENDAETVQYVRDLCGYFISYDNLFSTWVKKGNDFEISNVRDARYSSRQHRRPQRRHLGRRLAVVRHVGEQGGNIQSVVRGCGGLQPSLLAELGSH